MVAPISDQGHRSAEAIADPDGISYLAWKANPNKRRRGLLERLEVAETEAERAAIRAELDQHGWMVERGLL